jgi:hypothetical protein
MAHDGDKAPAERTPQFLVVMDKLYEVRCCCCVIVAL